jgi:hypothetical protein
VVWGKTVPVVHSLCFLNVLFIFYFLREFETRLKDDLTTFGVVEKPESENSPGLVYFHLFQSCERFHGNKT